MPFKIVRNDLTKTRADAIVNTANPRPEIGDGTDRAVYEAAGKDQLLEARKKIGRIGRGQAAITPAFNLKAKYIIHAVGPVWVDGNQGEEIILRSCYENSLQLAEEYECNSVAFPLISTGCYGFPRSLALDIVKDVVMDFLEKDKRDMMIYLVVFDKETTRLSEDLAAGMFRYIDDHYVEKKRKSEYTGRRNSNRFRKNSMVLEDRAEMKALAPDDERMAWDDDRISWDEDGMDWDEDREYMEVPEPSQTIATGGSSIFKSENKSYARKLGRKKSLDDILNHSEETFQTMLFRLIREKGMTNPQVYKKANIKKKLFSKIKQNVDYHPKKNTVLALAFALELNLDQTRDLLERAGFALSPSSRFDLAISYFIENGIYNMFTVEDILFSHGLGTLSNY